MFQKLRNFSDDVAKSISDLGIPDNPTPQQAQLAERIKNGEKILSTQTPDPRDLTQPEDVPVDETPATAKEDTPIEPLESASNANGKEPSPKPLAEKASTATPPPKSDEIDLEALSPVVRSKMKKFYKYEEKYPVLLNAFKIEKQKGELVAAFEKILREHTPVLSIADVGLLMQYLEGLTTKTTMLNAELRKVTSAKGEAEKLAKSADAEVAKLKQEVESVKQSKLDLKKELEGRLSQLEEAGDSDTLSEEMQQLRSQLDEKTELLGKTQTELDEKIELLGKAQSELEEKDELIKKQESELAERPPASSDDGKLAELEVEHKKLREEHDKLLEEHTKLLQEHAKAKEEHEQALQLLKNEHDTSVDQLKLEHSSKLDLVAGDHSKTVELLKEDHTKAVDLLKQDHSQAVELLKQTHTTALDDLETKNKEAAAAKDAEWQKKVDAAESKHQKLEEQQKKATEALKEAECAKQTLEDKLAAASSATTAAEAPSGKKKNKKGKEKAVESAAPTAEVSDAHAAEVDALKLEKQKLTRELRDKSEEIETLRDSVRDIGNDLVEARDEIKELKKGDGQLAAKVAEIDTLRKESESTKKELAEAAAKLEKAVKDHQAKVDSLEKEIETQSKAVADHKLAAEKLKNEAELSKKEAGDHKKLLDELQKEMRTHQKAADTHKLAVEAHQKEIEAHKKEIDELKRENERLQKEMATNEKALEAHKKEVAEQQQKLAAQTSAHNELQQKLAEAEKQVSVLEEDKQLLTNRIGELSKNNDTSLKLEIAALQSSITHKDQSITEYKKQIDQLQRKVDDAHEKISQLKVANNQLETTTNQLRTEKNELLTKHEVTAERVALLTNDLSKKQLEKQELASNLERLQARYDLLVREKLLISTDVESFRHQYEELLMRAKETAMKMEALEDELAEARNMLQERTREGTLIRRLLVEAEEQLKTAEQSYKNELKRANEERDEVTMDSQRQLKKRQREIDDLTAQIEGYNAKISDLQQEVTKATQQNKALVLLVDGGLDPKELHHQLETLRASLQDSSRKAHEYETMNNTLKKLNDEANLKFERLSKNYKILTQQYREIEQKKLAEPSPAPQPQAPAKADNLANVDYLKNVLLGFFEHKEQRPQLLPVLKTLFHMSGDEEKKLLLALK